MVYRPLKKNFSGARSLNAKKAHRIWDPMQPRVQSSAGAPHRPTAVKGMKHWSTEALKPIRVGEPSRIRKGKAAQKTLWKTLRSNMLGLQKSVYTLSLNKNGTGVTQVTWFAVGCSFRGTMHQENNTASISSIGAWPGSIGFWVICWGILFTMFNGHPGLPSDTICWLRVQDISSMPPSDGFSWTPWAWKPQCVFMCMDRWERLGSRHLTPRSIELLRHERAGGWRAAVF